MSFVLILYSLGALSCIISGRIIQYVTDYKFLIASLICGLTIAYLFNTLRRVDDALVYANERLGRGGASPSTGKFGKFVAWVQAWCPFGDSVLERAPFWYYLETLGGATLGSLVGFYWTYLVTYETPWWGVSQFGVSSVFFVVWAGILGYAIGACVFLFLGAIKVLRQYCKDFVTSKQILALNPDRVGGLKPFAQISLNLDIVLSLPSTVILVYLAGGLSINDPGVWPMLVLYTVLLVIVFFVPISPAHDAMRGAKNLAYEEVNNMFIGIHTSMSKRSKKFDPAILSSLNDVHLLHERVSKMAVWPFDLGILAKFIFTALYPIVGSIIIAYLTMHLGLK
jgi:hypothetical protein